MLGLKGGLGCHVRMFPLILTVLNVMGGYHRGYGYYKVEHSLNPEPLFLSVDASVLWHEHFRCAYGLEIFGLGLWCSDPLCCQSSSYILLVRCSAYTHTLCVLLLNNAIHISDTDISV